MWKPAAFTSLLSCDLQQNASYGPGGPPPPQASQFTATGMHRRHLLLSLLICSFFPSSSSQKLGAEIWLQGQEGRKNQVGQISKMWFSLLCVRAQSCPTLLGPHGLEPTRLLSSWTSPGKILEWVAIPFSRRSIQPRDRTQVSCIAGRFFTT